MNFMIVLLPFDKMCNIINVILYIYRGINIMEFNSNGVFPPGIHDFAIEYFKEKFVTEFPASQTREKIFNSLIDFVESISNQCNPQEIWIDGSYVTCKENPNDIDVILFFKYESFTSNRDIPNIIRNHQDIDSYVGIYIDKDLHNRIPKKDYANVVNNRNYWRGQFGFDRNDLPKGIIKMDWNLLQSYMIGGVI